MNKTVRIIICIAAAALLVVGIMLCAVSCTDKPENTTSSVTTDSPSTTTEATPSESVTDPTTDPDETTGEVTGDNTGDVTGTDTDKNTETDIDPDTETDPAGTGSDTSGQTSASESSSPDTKDIETGKDTETSTGKDTETETDKVTDTDKVTETETDKVTEEVTTDAETSSSDTTSADTTSGDNPSHTHSYTSKVTKEATCTEKGVKTYTCSCGESYTEDIAAKGHKWSAWKTTKAATCKATGVKERECSVCHKKETQSIAKTSHNWSAWKTTKEATCKEAGVKERTCSICGEKQTEAIAKTNTHTWGAWKVTKEATTTSTGTKERTCSVCGKKETETIPKVTSGECNHNWSEWKVVRESTITTPGVKERTCSICGKKETDDLPYLESECEMHPYDGDWKNAEFLRYEAPTCTLAGYYFYRCKHCGKEFASNFDTNGEYHILFATGHTWGEWKVTKEPTATEDGEMTCYCTVCGEKKTNPIDKTGQAVWEYRIVSRKNKDSSTTYGIIFDNDEGAHYNVRDYRTWGTSPNIVRTGENEVTVSWKGKNGEGLIVTMHGYDPHKHLSCGLKIYDDGTYMWQYVVSG